jgi:hypothetical protein
MQKSALLIILMITFLYAQNNATLLCDAEFQGAIANGSTPVLSVKCDNQFQIEFETGGLDVIKADGGIKLFYQSEFDDASTWYEIPESELFADALGWWQNMASVGVGYTEVTKSTNCDATMGYEFKSEPRSPLEVFYTGIDGVVRIKLVLDAQYNNSDVEIFGSLEVNTVPSNCGAPNPAPGGTCVDCPTTNYNDNRFIYGVTWANSNQPRVLRNSQITIRPIIDCFVFQGYTAKDIEVKVGFYNGSASTRKTVPQTVYLGSDVAVWTHIIGTPDAPFSRAGGCEGNRRWGHLIESAPVTCEKLFAPLRLTSNYAPGVGPFFVQVCIRTCSGSFPCSDEYKYDVYDFHEGDPVSIEMQPKATYGH